MPTAMPRTLAFEAGFGEHALPPAGCLNVNGEGGMNCLHCGREIPDSFFSRLGGSPEFKGGRFACPHCGAEHVRRTEGTLPSGAPLHTFRLWGHPTTVRRQARPAAVGTERRQRARNKRWR